MDSNQRTLHVVRFAGLTVLACWLGTAPSNAFAQIRVTSVRSLPATGASSSNAASNASSVASSQETASNQQHRATGERPTASVIIDRASQPIRSSTSTGRRLGRVWLADAGSQTQEKSLDLETATTELPEEDLGSARPEPPSNDEELVIGQGANPEYVATDIPNSPTIMAGVATQPVSLKNLIRSSIASRRIFNSLEGEVVVERLTGYDPEVVTQDWIVQQSRFDPSVTSRLIGNHVDQPSNSFFGPGIELNTRRDEAEFASRLSKIWPTGLSTAVGYEPSLAYLFFPTGNSAGFNPTHSSDLVLRAVQPLLQGRGTDANLASVRIAERRIRQSSLEVEATVQRQLRSIEQVYWELHAHHVRLRAIDEAIVLARKTVEIVTLRFEAERTIYADVARAQVKLEDLYQQRLAAELDIRRSSFDLSQLVGIDFRENLVLIPVDNPENRPPQLDSDGIIKTAITCNPDLRRQREEIAISKTEIVFAANNMLPELNLQALHRTAGADNDLGTALGQMSRFEFNDFTLGVEYSQQLGLRNGKSKLKAARLVAAREAALMAAFERQIGYEVLKSLSELELAYSRYESALRQLSQAQKWVQLAQLRYEDPPLQGSGQESLLVSLLDYQTALQSRVDALTLVADGIAEYNAKLAVVEEKRGTMLSRWGIQLSGN